MNAAIERLTEEVTEAKTVAESAGTLLRGIAAQLREKAGDEAAVLQLAQDLDAGTAGLQTAVAESSDVSPA